MTKDTVDQTTGAWIEPTTDLLIERKPLSAEEVLMSMIARTTKDLAMSNHQLRKAETEVTYRAEEVSRLETIKEGLDATLEAIRSTSISATTKTD